MVCLGLVTMRVPSALNEPERERERQRLEDDGEHSRRRFNGT